MQGEQHFLRSIYVLFKKELMSYFNSPIAYIYLAVFLVLGNWLFVKPFFLNGELSMRAYFTLLPWILLFMAPAITMRSWSEEKKSGTIEFLLTLPLSSWQLVLAKFAGALSFLLIGLLLSLTLPFSLNRLGDLDLGPVIGGYLGALCLGSAYLAIGLLASVMTKNQIIALITSLAICFVLFIIGQQFILVTVPVVMAKFFSFISLGARFDNITRGLVDSRDLIYYLSFSYFCLWLNVKLLEARKWQ
jgi:ABC-2 type transport system permease protein